VWETIRVYEELLFLTHGTRRRAAGTRPMITKWGEKEALRRSVRDANGSAALALLVKYDRPDCSFEQIVLDFADEFDTDTVEKARTSLTSFEAELESQPVQAG
jgi:hypothetical protein